MLVRRPSYSPATSHGA
jgi:hypothetical protein